MQVMTSASGMDDEKSLEQIAIDRMCEFVSEPYFGGEEEKMHRVGLKSVYEEAARLEYGFVAEKDDFVELEQRVSRLRKREDLISGLCREIEGALAKMSRMNSLREEALEKAGEVKTACDGLLSEQKKYSEDADRLERDLLDVQLPVLIEDDLEKSFEELDMKEARLEGREIKFSDEEDVLEDLRKLRKVWCVQLLDMIKRALGRQENDTVRQLHSLLSRHDEESAEACRRYYCSQRGFSSSSVSEIDCAKERKLYADLFGVEDGAIDEALHRACEDTVHSKGRTRVLRATTLAELKAILDEYKELGESESVDDAMRAAANKVRSDAQERAVFVASSELRTRVELAKPTTADLEQAAKENGGGVLYSPIKEALTILEHLHGAVKDSVFDDFAQGAVALCVSKLKQLPNLPHNVRDLFIIKHLLALRDRVVPFGITYGTVVKRTLNWATSHAQQQALLEKKSATPQKKKGWWPKVDESTVDARKELETELKARCAAFVKDVTRGLTEQLSHFLTSIQKECPKDCDVARGDAPRSLVTKLRGLPQAQPSEIGRILRTSLTQARSHLEKVHQNLLIFIDNAHTRQLLLKPAKSRSQIAFNEFKATTTILLSSDISAELDPLFTEYSALIN